MTLTDLDPNIDQRLGLTNNNCSRTYSWDWMESEPIRFHTRFRSFESHNWSGQKSTSGNSVRKEITGEVLSETAMQHCSVNNCWHDGQRMYNVARQDIWDPLYTTVSWRYYRGCTSVKIKNLGNSLIELIIKYLI